MRAITSHFIGWNGGCLFLSGRAEGITPMHAHYAIQIAFGPEPGIRFRPGEHAPWETYCGVIIPSRQPHAMDATALSASAVLFVEPETREGRTLAERYLEGGIASLPDHVFDALVPPLFQAWRDERSADVVSACAQQLIRGLTGGEPPSEVSDERILRAIAYIQAHVGQSITLEHVAAEACLSPSRFRHLFVEQTGVGLRPYVLWRRLLRVWELLAGGASLSAAAHAAGFADAAHLSRTSRTMFGFPPSAMQMGAPLRVGSDPASWHRTPSPVRMGPA